MSTFCTVVLTSTRQHWGLVDIDKITIDDTLSKSSLIKSSPKFIHIKTIVGDEEIALDKRKWFESRGFTVFETIGNWKNDDASHGTGLIEDMAKIYNHPEVLKCDYVLHLENDWRFNSENLDEELIYFINFLRLSPHIVYIRPTRIDQHDIIERLNGSCLNPSYKLFITNKEFSFNPFISRTRDMMYISSFVLKNKQGLNPHCEMAYEQAAKYLTNNNNIFVFFYNEIVEHLGSKEWCENYLKNNESKLR